MRVWCVYESVCMRWVGLYIYISASVFLPHTLFEGLRCAVHRPAGPLRCAAAVGGARVLLLSPAEQCHACCGGPMCRVRLQRHAHTDQPCPFSCLSFSGLLGH